MGHMWHETRERAIRGENETKGKYKDREEWGGQITMCLRIPLKKKSEKCIKYNK